MSANPRFRVAIGVVVTAIVMSLVLAAAGQAVQSPTTAELRRIFEQDQNEPYPKGVPEDSAARVAFFTAEWNKHFKPRQDRVTEIVRSGLLQSGEDYFLAGMIYNHGIKPEDNLLAHALLTVAALKEYPAARWASAAALDNYLAGIGRPQLFGTVFGENRVTMGDPMTDALRAQFCVPSTAKQAELAGYLKAGRGGRFDREKVACAPGIR